MQKDVFDQNDGSESAAGRKRGKEEKERCALYYLCFSSRRSFASSRRTRNRQKSSVWEVRDAAPMSGIATPSAPIAGSADVLATMMSMCAVMLPCFAFGYSLQKL